MKKTSLNFLRSKNMISPDHTEFMIKSDHFGTICLNKLLDEYVKYKEKAELESKVCDDLKGLKDIEIECKGVRIK